MKKHVLSTKAQNNPVYQVYISAILLFGNQGDGVKGNRLSLTGITYILPCNNANEIKYIKKKKKSNKMHKPQTIKRSNLTRAPSRAKLSGGFQIHFFYFLTQNIS